MQELQAVACRCHGLTDVGARPTYLLQGRLDRTLGEPSGSTRTERQV